MKNAVVICTITLREERSGVYALLHEHDPALLHAVMTHVCSLCRLGTRRLCREAGITTATPISHAVPVAAVCEPLPDGQLHLPLCDGDRRVLFRRTCSKVTSNIEFRVLIQKSSCETHMHIFELPNGLLENVFHSPFIDESKLELNPAG